MEKHVFPQKANDGVMLDKRHGLGSSVTKRDLGGSGYGLRTVLGMDIRTSVVIPCRVYRRYGRKVVLVMPTLARTEGGWMARDRKELSKYGIPDPPRPSSMLQLTNVTF
jgi:hypothetical protein